MLTVLKRVFFVWFCFILVDCNHLKLVLTVSCLHSGQIIKFHPATKSLRSFGAVQEVSPHKKGLFWTKEVIQFAMIVGSFDPGKLKYRIPRCYCWWYFNDCKIVEVTVVWVIPLHQAKTPRFTCLVLDLVLWMFPRLTDVRISCLKKTFQLCGMHRCAQKLCENDLMAGTKWSQTCGSAGPLWIVTVARRFAGSCWRWWRRFVRCGMPWSDGKMMREIVQDRGVY